ncbi:MAG: leucine-rich repeat domain-containing protein [Lachnospiraceae bacterium]|nr:leucine-rich repeat domain-containing protein [Lachnospiraceae bacterium]
MKGKISKALATVLSLTMVFSIVLSSVPAKADPDGDIYRITAEDEASSESNRFYCSDPGYPSNPSWKNIVYDKSTQTLTLNNVNMSKLQLSIHGGSGSGEIHIKLTGNNKIGHLYVCFMKAVYFEGNGSLIINEPQNGVYFRPSAIRSEIGSMDGSTLCVTNYNIAADTTLTLYGDTKNDPPYQMETGSLYYWCNITDKLVQFDTSKMITYGGQVSPAVAWKPVQNEEKNYTDDPETGKIQFARIDIPIKNLYIKKNDAGIATVSENNLWAGFTNGYGFTYGTPLEKGANGWMLGEDYDTLLSVDNYSQVSANTVFLDDMPYNATNDTFTIKHPSVVNNADSYLFSKNNESYALFRMGDVVDANLMTIADISGHIDHWTYAKVNNGVVSDLVSINYEKGDSYPASAAWSYMKGQNFSCKQKVVSTYYSNELWLSNTKITFSPKQTANVSNVTQASIKGAEYKITVDKDGSKTAEYVKTDDSKVKTATVPETVETADGKATVTSIASNAFANCKNLTSVNMPKTIEQIGAGAFQNCAKLTSVNIPAGTKTIGKNAFKNCKAMKSVKFKGNNVETIESGAFSGCKKLTNVTVTKNVKSIKANAFAGTGKLTKVTIKSKSVKIAKNAFKGHKNTKVYISKKLKGKAKTNFVKMLTKAGFKKKNIKAK